MRSDAGLLQLAQDLGGHAHALLHPINQNRHGVQVVLEFSIDAILGVRNLVTERGNSRKFERE